MPNMWNFLIGALDKGAPYAAQGEQFRQNDVQLGIAQQNADTQEFNAETTRMNQDLMREQWEDQLVDFDAMRQGYTGPLNDEMAAIARAVGGRKTAYGKIVPWIQPETYRAMQSGQINWEREKLSAQAKALADQVEALARAGVSMSQLRPPVSVPAGTVQSVPGTSTAEKIGAYVDAAPWWTMPGLLGRLGMWAGGPLAEWLNPSVYDREYAPVMMDVDVNGPASTATMQAGADTYKTLIGLLRSGYMPSELNLSVPYTAQQYTSSPEVAGLLSGNPFASSYLQGMAMMSDALTPQDVKAMEAMRTRQLLQNLGRMEQIEAQGDLRKELEQMKLDAKKKQ